MKKRINSSKEIDSQNKVKIQSIKELIINEIKEVNGLNAFTGELELDNKSIKELCFSLSNEIDNLFMIVLSSSDEKYLFHVLFQRI